MATRNILAIVVLGLALVACKSRDDVARSADSSRRNALRDTPTTSTIHDSASTGWVVATRVDDRAALLNVAERAELESMLASIEQSSTVQIVILTVESLGSMSIEAAALATFRASGIGQRGVNNGVLVLLAPNEKTVRIEVGFGLEWQLSDSTAATIIDAMSVGFRAGDYASGFRVAIDRIAPLVTAVPWTVRYRNLSEIERAAAAAQGEIAQLTGQLRDVDSVSATLAIGDRTIPLRLPSHWARTPNRGTGAYQVTARVASTSPLVLHALGVD